MDFIAYLLALLLVGLVVGAFARLALPGKDPMTIPQTIAVGVAGSLLAGLVGALLFGRGSGGILLSIIFAAGIVYLTRRSRGGGLMDPGAPPDR
jgi:uncharacterized membrane protein YeaQ/YmgE (transglycosylase-associated protein family)